MSTSRPGQVRETLREEQKEAVHACAQKANSRSVSPHMMPLVLNVFFVLFPLLCLPTPKVFLSFLLEADLLSGVKQSGDAYVVVKGGVIDWQECE